MRRAISAFCLLLATSPALAAEGGDAKAGAPGTNVEMPFLIAPMNGADGKLAGYAYISSRLTASSDAAANDVRDKIAFVQDAFVRDVNGSSIAKADDPGAVNQPALQARLLADARRIMGSAKVTSLSFIQVQIAPLHPKQTAMPDALPPDSPPAAPASK